MALLLRECVEAPAPCDGVCDPDTRELSGKEMAGRTRGRKEASRAHTAALKQLWAWQQRNSEQADAPWRMIRRRCQNARKGWQPQPSRCEVDLPPLRGKGMRKQKSPWLRTHWDEPQAHNRVAMRADTAQYTRRCPSRRAVDVARAADVHG